MPTYDAIVVGARVAGSPTALLLARKGYRVLLVDRDRFPSDVISTHMVHVPAIAALKRWSLLDRVVATGTPPMESVTFDLGELQISGQPPALGGVDAGYCIRRTVLDTILVEGAEEAGVEVRTGFSVSDLIERDGQVVGIRGRDADGRQVEEYGTIVVGADGMHSRVARAVAAHEYNGRPTLTAAYYSYWSGVKVDEAKIFVRPGLVIGVLPTTGGQTCVFVQFPRKEFGAFKGDIPGNFWRALKSVPEAAALMDGARQGERFYGTGDCPNFFRVPFGPGWALVGDAGYHRDPTLGHGIMDAFFQAELLVEALDDAFSGRLSMREALTVFQQQRDLHHGPDYDLIVSMSDLENPPPAEVQALMAAVAANPEATRQYLGVIAGVVSPAAFFAPENVCRIMAEAAMPAAA